MWGGSFGWGKAGLLGRFSSSSEEAFWKPFGPDFCEVAKTVYLYKFF